MKEIAVVILNWNGIKHLSEFLPSVLKHTNHNLADIYVIDNASTDHSVDFIKSNFNTVKIIQNKQNKGFAGGYNLGLQQISCPYFVLLNSDVEVSPGWIEPLYLNMKNDAAVAACQPKILDYKNKALFEHAGAAGGFIDKLGFPFCRGRLFYALEKDQGQYNNKTEIFWATGACMMIRAELFKQENGFDDRFFAHMEEIDLCWRLKNKGYKILFIHNATVFHLGGGTLSTISPNKTYLNFRNNLFLLYKNLPQTNLLSTLFKRMLLDGVAFFHFLLTLKPQHAWAVFRAHRAFYKALSYLNKYRRTAPVQKPLKKISGVYQGSIVYDFYIRKIKLFSLLNASKFRQ